MILKLFGFVHNTISIHIFRFVPVKTEAGDVKDNAQ